MDIAIKLLAYYTAVATMAFIGMSIWQVGETKEHSRTGAVLTFLAMGIVMIFAILVLLRG